MEFGYVDDGGVLLPLKYVLPYINQLKIEYGKFGLQVNPIKTKIICKVHNREMADKIKNEFNGYNINTTGNWEFLGIPHHMVIQNIFKIGLSNILIKYIKNIPYYND